MALKFELLPDEMRPKAVQYLADNIAAKGNHLSTGFLGVNCLLPTLTAGGKLDTAYQLLLQDSFPSWLFSVKNGATTIWERWDGWTPDRGFQSPSMNSFNHYSFGSCGEWLYDTVAGIGFDPEAVGFKNIIIHPQPGGGLTWAKGSVGTIRGRVTTAWTLQGSTFTLDCTIPMNATATVILPTGDSGTITEGGRALSPGGEIRVEAGTPSGQGITLHVGSGSYHFSCTKT